MRSSEVSDIAKEKSCQKSFNTFVYSSLPALIISSFSSSPAVKSYSIYFCISFHGVTRFDRSGALLALFCGFLKRSWDTLGRSWRALRHTRRPRDAQKVPKKRPRAQKKVPKSQHRSNLAGFGLRILDAQASPKLSKVVC